MFVPQRGTFKSTWIITYRTLHLRTTTVVHWRTKHIISVKVQHIEPIYLLTNPLHPATVKILKYNKIRKKMETKQLKSFVNFETEIKL